MFLMMAEVLELARVARSFPESPTWQALAFHQSHVEWAGCSVHDMIQPSFSFLVGVALPFSLASRAPAGGVDAAGRSLHAAWRALVLIALGIFLRSIGRKMTNFTFEDTLTQIGLGYLPLFLLGLARPWVRWVALGVILVGYWGAFAAYPARRARLRLPGRRRPGRLAAPRDRPRRALEQEQQPGLGVRPLVPQPVSPGKPLHPQRRRLRDAELHPDPGDDAPRPDRRGLAERAGGRRRQARPDGPGRRSSAWPPAWRSTATGSARSSSGSGRRPGSCSAAGSASRRWRCSTRLIDLTGLRRVDVPAPGDRPELDRRLLSWPT